MLAQSAAVTHPEAATILKQDFYMDDMLTGVNTIAQGVKVCHPLMDLLASGGFCLRKWAANCQAIFKDLPTNLQDERNIYDLDSKNAVIKTLGLKYNLSDYCFLFDTPKGSKAEFITKQIAVSDTAKLFNLLGLVGPEIVLAKTFLQKLCEKQLS